ncbi:MAG: hypothetical protein JXB47_01785 [Anaerolineae bacterium]|nr:hypothetical protein [Anaerolineae bacterium]
MSKLGQFGVATALLGLVIAFMGLFPGTLGLDPTEGIGILQIIVTLAGFALLNAGAYIYVKDTWFRGRPYTLGQSVGLRLTWTGLLVAAASGMADLLGFGSHPPGEAVRPLLGLWQAIGFVFGFLMSTFGVVVFVLFGDLSDSGAPGEPGDEAGEDNEDEEDKVEVEVEEDEERE